MFIPTRTQEVSSHLRIPVAYAGLDLRSLRVNGAVWGGDLGATAEELRNSLRVPSNTAVFCILNGQDKLLERFWSKNRNHLYRQAKQWEITAITGPTFSVYGEDQRLPSSHNVLALSRHHRCIQEISDSGLTAVPNLYWRNDADLRAWVDFLDAHPELNVVSRDFSCTKGLEEFDTHLQGLTWILERVGRPMHVFFVGVGTSKAHRVIDILAERGCTCSFFTADPVMTARSGGKRLINDGAKLITRVEREIPHVELILGNLVAAEQFLVEKASQYAIYTHPSNGLLACVDLE
ncbi:MAG TPA: DUF4417 domain-containing protein [Longimicrobium sp.]|nr:DUF4417 domain-containing protein [Longimicrobium sp.]